MKSDGMNPPPTARLKVLCAFEDYVREGVVNPQRPEQDWGPRFKSWRHGERWWCSHIRWEERDPDTLPKTWMLIQNYYTRLPVDNRWTLCPICETRRPKG